MLVRQIITERMVELLLPWRHPGLYQASSVRTTLWSKADGLQNGIGFNGRGARPKGRALWSADAARGREFSRFTPFRALHFGSHQGRSLQRSMQQPPSATPAFLH